MNEYLSGDDNRSTVTCIEPFSAFSFCFQVGTAFTYCSMFNLSMHVIQPRRLGVSYLSGRISYRSCWLVVATSPYFPEPRPTVSAQAQRATYTVKGKKRNPSKNQGSCSCRQTKNFQMLKTFSQQVKVMLRNESLTTGCIMQWFSALKVRQYE